MSTVARSAGARTVAVPLRLRARIAIVAVTIVGIGAFVWPLLIGFGARGAPHSTDAPWIFLVLLPLLMVVVAAELADGGMDAKAVALLGVLAGMSAILRPVSGGVTGVQLMFFVLIPAGRVLGPGFGFVLGNLAMFASAAITGGGGPWLPFQMLAAGWIGLGAGLLPRARGRAELAMLAVYGLLAGVAYGFVLNLWFWPFGASGTGLTASVTFSPDASVAENLSRWLRFSVTTSLSFDIPRGLATAAAILALGRPMLLALRRAARKAAFDSPAEFDPPLI
ncbi:MAG: transporter component [Pseudonocardiales bacterium]|nr:transporter component [Pseudonocardiales bacterium]